MGGHPLSDWLADGGEAGEGPEPREEADEPARPRRRRLMLLVAGAAALWVAVALVIALPSVRGDGDAGQGVTSSDGGHRQGEAPTGDGEGLATAPSAGTEAPGGVVTSSPELPPDVAALAAVTTRLEVSRLGDGAGTSRYVDLAVAEGAEQAGDVLVVSVLAVVLEGEADQWTASRVERYAIPVAHGPTGDPALAGSPWALPSPADAPAEEPAWTASEAPVDGVAAALAAAGYGEVSDLETARAGDAPLLRASFTASDSAGRQEAWLTDEPEPRVLGTGARALNDMEGDH